MSTFKKLPPIPPLPEGKSLEDFYGTTYIDASCDEEDGPEIRIAIARGRMEETESGELVATCTMSLLYAFKLAEELLSCCNQLVEAISKK